MPDRVQGRRNVEGYQCLAGAVALCEGGAGEIVNPYWSDRQGQVVEGSQDP
jgi:hypothetical protein